MQNQEQPEAKIEPMRGDQPPQPVPFTKVTGSHGIIPSSGPWPDLSGNIDRLRRESAFSQEVSVDA